MANASTQFGGFLTNVGIAQQANTAALGIPWNITHMLIGDAGGEPSVTPDPTPSPAQTALVRQVHRAQLNALYQSPTDPAVLVAELVLPPETGGWWIRELALEDANGNFIAVAKPPPSYKPLLAQGSGRTQTIRMHVLFGNTANVSLKIDPSIVLATRDYVDTAILSALNKQDFKHSVQVATTAAIALNGLQTVDGVALSAGARVLVRSQAAAKDNGIYVVAAGAWVRADDGDASSEVTSGLFVHVEQGAVGGDTVWQLTTDAPITLGTTGLVFEQIAGPSGVTAGTYRSVTVDRNGRVMAGTNPATLAAAGITDAYTQAQVDSAIAIAVNNLDYKNSVQVATTAAIALSALQTVDGVALSAGARVLVKNQAAAKDNGIYVVAAGAWARAVDADASVEVTPGLFVHVEQGAVGADTVWQLTTNAPITLGTTGLVFEQIAGPSGVTAGTYRSVTVDRNGRVTAGTNPATLAAAGITDAYTKPEVDALVAAAISSKRVKQVARVTSAALQGISGATVGPVAFSPLSTTFEADGGVYAIRARLQFNVSTSGAAGSNYVSVTLKNGATVLDTWSQNISENLWRGESALLRYTNPMSGTVNLTVNFSKTSTAGSVFVNGDRDDTTSNDSGQVSQLEIIRLGDAA
nr:phage tail protein [Pseudomonas sp. EMN2]